MRSKYIIKIDLDIIIVVLMFILLNKIQFLPSSLYTVMRMGITLLLFIYILKNNEPVILNDPTNLLFFSMLLSCFHGFLRLPNFSLKDLFDGLYYVLRLFCVFQTTIIIIKKKVKEKTFFRSLFFTNLIYCILAVVFINHQVYVINEDIGSIMYILGNKFVTSYLFILLSCLFYQNYTKQIKRFALYKFVFIGLIILSVIVSFYIDCKTAVVGSIVPLIFYILNDKWKKTMFNWKIVILMIFIATYIPFVFEYILNMELVRYIIVNVLKRGLRLTGRLTVYNNYVIPLIRDQLLFGYGYSNNPIFSVSGIYHNAQNGLLEFIMLYGMLGAIFLLYSIISIFQRIKSKTDYLGIVMLLYSMIFMGTVEVTYNVHFFLSIAILNTIKEKQSSLNL